MRTHTPLQPERPPGCTSRAQLLQSLRAVCLQLGDLACVLCCTRVHAGQLLVLCVWGKGRGACRQAVQWWACKHAWLAMNARVQSASSSSHVGNCSTSGQHKPLHMYWCYPGEHVFSLTAGSIVTALVLLCSAGLQTQTHLCFADVLFRGAVGQALLQAQACMLIVAP